MSGDDLTTWAEANAAYLATITEHTDRADDARLAHEWAERARERERRGDKHLAARYWREADTCRRIAALSVREPADPDPEKRCPSCGHLPGDCADFCCTPGMGE